jgi:glycosyltransferase involved in cell wall biosynthesis
MGERRPGRVLYVGQAYYNAWYLSRALRERGWKADVLNWDSTPGMEGFYHGEDFTFRFEGRRDAARQLRFWLRALRSYDVFHFSNMHGLRFGPYLHDLFGRFGEGADVRWLKWLGKKIVYSNNGCLDGVAQSSFASWGERPVCLDCAWRDRPDICSDEGNLEWGKLRNSLADFQVTVGGNRIDYNDDPSVHEVPEFYCLDPDFWRPGLEIPPERRVDLPEGTVKIYHAVGNLEERSGSEHEHYRNIKSTHIYLPLIEQLKAEGLDVELMFFSDVPNREVRFYQSQADIVCDMLTYGFFGAGVREALMLGKPVVCYLRPEWLDQMRAEIPGYVEELPVVSATPETVHDVLADLVRDPGRREELGRRGREFALKWHSAEAGARRFDSIYGNLLAGRPGTEDFRSDDER